MIIIRRWENYSGESYTQVWLLYFNPNMTLYRDEVIKDIIPYDKNTGLVSQVRADQARVALLDHIT